MHLANIPQLWPAALRTNLRIKIGLLVLAAMLWFFVVTDRHYEIIAEIPIVYPGLKSGKMLSDEPPQVAHVKFQGTGKALLRLQFLEPPHLEINLATISHFYDFIPEPEMVILAGGLDVVPLDVLDPDTITIVLDDKMTTMLPVQPDVKITVADGFIQRAKAAANPAKVQISGPRRALTDLRALQTIPAKLSDLKRSKTLELALMRPRIYGVVIHPTSVNVTVSVERLGEKKVIEVAPQVLNAPRAREVVIDPYTVEITFIGGVSNLKSLSSANFKATVDFQSINMSRGGRAPVVVEVPPGVEVVAVIPPEVRLIVRKD